MNLDDHPLRHAAETQAIERVLYRRALEKKLDGYTLETAIEIAEQLTPDLVTRLRAKIKTVVHTFERDEAQGYHSKDRQFALSILKD